MPKPKIKKEIVVKKDKKKEKIEKIEKIVVSDEPKIDNKIVSDEVKIEKEANIDEVKIKKSETPKEIISSAEKNLALKPDRYFEAIGRRKTAVARVRLFTKGEKAFLINGKSYKDYFNLLDDQEKAASSMEKMKCFDKFKVTVIVRGGGRSAQAEAVRHGTARVLVLFNNNFKKRLRKVGYLTRDPRMRERKKFGLKRARKSPQWSKR